MFYRILLFLFCSAVIGCGSADARAENTTIEEIIRLMLTQKDNYFYLDVAHYPKERKAVLPKIW